MRTKIFLLGLAGLLTAGCGAPPIGNSTVPAPTEAESSAGVRKVVLSLPGMT